MACTNVWFGFVEKALQEQYRSANKHYPSSLSFTTVVVAAELEAELKRESESCAVGRRAAELFVEGNCTVTLSKEMSPFPSFRHLVTEMKATNYSH